MFLWTIDATQTVSNIGCQLACGSAGLQQQGRSAGKNEHVSVCARGVQNIQPCCCMLGGQDHSCAECSRGRSIGTARVAFDKKMSHSLGVLFPIHLFHTYAALCAGACCAFSDTSAVLCIMRLFWWVVQQLKLLCIVWLVSGHVMGCCTWHSVHQGTRSAHVPAGLQVKLD